MTAHHTVRLLTIAFVYVTPSGESDHYSLFRIGFDDLRCRTIASQDYIAKAGRTVTGTSQSPGNSGDAPIVQAGSLTDAIPIPVLIICVLIAIVMVGAETYDKSRVTAGAELEKWRCIRKGMTESEVRGSVGPPARIASNALTDQTTWFYARDGEIRFVGGRVTAWVEPQL